MGQTQSKGITEYNYRDLNDLIEKSDDYLKDQWQKLNEDNTISYWLGDDTKYKVGIREDEWPLKTARDDLTEGNHYFRLSDETGLHYFDADEDRWTGSGTHSDFLDDLSDKWNNLLQSAKDYAQNQSQKDEVVEEVVKVADEHKEAHETAKENLIAMKKEQTGGDPSEDRDLQRGEGNDDNDDNVPTIVIDHGPLGKEVQKEYTLTLKAGETYEVTDLASSIPNISRETMVICSSDCNEQREMGSVATLEISSDLNQLLKTMEMYWLGGIANPATGVSDLPLISIIYGNDKQFNQVSMYLETKYALNISHVSNENLEQIKNFFGEKEIPYQ